LNVDALVLTDEIGMRASNVLPSRSASPSMRLYPGIAAAEIQSQAIKAGIGLSLQMRWQDR
jgi:hypothetical protein